MDTRRRFTDNVKKKTGNHLRKAKRQPTGGRKEKKLSLQGEKPKLHQKKGEKHWRRGKNVSDQRIQLRQVKGLNVTDVPEPNNAAVHVLHNYESTIMDPQKGSKGGNHRKRREKGNPKRNKDQIRRGRN